MEKWICTVCGHTEFWRGMQLRENGIRVYWKICAGRGCICTHQEVEKIEPSLKHLLPKSVRPFEGLDMIKTKKEITVMQPRPRFTSINGVLTRIS